MVLKNLRHLPVVGINKNKFDYHEIAEVFYSTNSGNEKNRRVVMYVGGLNYSGNMTGAKKTLVGFLGIKFKKKLFGNLKASKDSIFIPADSLIEYRSLEKRVK